MASADKIVKKDIGVDWQENWGSSIAIKVTAPVLWALVFVGMVIAIVVQNNIASELEESINKDADRLAYAASHKLMDLGVGQLSSLMNGLKNDIKETNFAYIVLVVNSNRLILGEHTEKQIKMIRQVPIVTSSTNAKALVATLELYHPPIKQLISTQRKQHLVKIGIPFVLFGLFLAWLIHFIVTKPIFELVNATKAVTDGDLSLRLQTTRKDEFGHLSEFFNQMLDKLQAKQVELSTAVEQAEAASQMKSSFLANMSHEIRTPLTAILGYSDMLKHTVEPKEQREQKINSILRAGKHLQEIINDILDLSKIEAGQLVVEFLSISPIDMVNEINEIISVRAAEKGIDFFVEYNFPLPKRIYTDPTRLRQILLNLCSNAVKFTNEGNVSISIRYVPDSGLMTFEVVDTGIGMTQREIERIFKQFTQADASTTRQYGGTGLGLCISRQLANKLGGDVTCTSAKSVGSKFILSIATGKVDELFTSLEIPKVSSTLTNPHLPTNSLQGDILLAEDTIDNQLLIFMYVERAGANVTVVENGELAVNKAMMQDFDLILMDMQMPVMGGVEATAKLREMGYKKPIVVITANALKEDREKCKAIGADDFITKPLDLTRFYNVLQQYLRTSTHTEHNSDYFSHELADDAEFMEIVNLYVSELPDKISRLETALQDSKWAQLQSIVHNLKGTGASYGYDVITQIATPLNDNLKQNVLDNVEQQTHHLIEVCQQIIALHQSSLRNAS